MPMIAAGGRRCGPTRAPARLARWLLGGAAAAWPLVARAQQSMPVIGLLGITSLGNNEARLRAFRQGLKEIGYVEGENVALEYRWAEDQIDRLPALAADLVQRRAAVIFAISPPVVLAAKTAIKTIPIVFIINEDPVRLGLVASLNRPGGNLTGINILIAEVTAKRLDLLRELMPSATRVGVLVNPANATNTETTLREMKTAARTTRLQVKVLNASTSQEIEAAFASLLHERPDALFVGAEAYFFNRRVQLVVLAASHRLPAIYSQRDFVETGGLMSYGTNIADAFRQIGVYAGRIVKGVKPADLPVVQASKFELVINLPTARLEVPPMLLARADEVTNDRRGYKFLPVSMFQSGRRTWRCVSSSSSEIFQRLAPSSANSFEEQQQSRMRYCASLVLTSSGLTPTSPITRRSASISPEMRTSSASTRRSADFRRPRSQRCAR